MSKTALLAQNDNLAIDELKQSVGRSVFDLSHTTTFPINPDGAILPICCIETVPSDSFQINVECLLRQLSPLAVPQMVNYRLNTAFYYCSNRIAWKKWDRFLEGGRSGDEVYDIPRVCNVQNAKNLNDETITSCLSDVITTNTSGVYSDYSNLLHTYFGIQSNLSYDLISNTVNSSRSSTSLSEDCPVAFPFFDYQLICRDYYTDIDRLADTSSSNRPYGSKPFADWAYANLYPADDDEIRLVDGIQIRSGFQSGDDSSVDWHGFYLDKVRYHNVRDDYFTTSKKAPMRGTAPEIQTSSSTITLPSGTELNIGKINASTNLLNTAEGSETIPLTFTGQGTNDFLVTADNKIGSTDARGLVYITPPSTTNQDVGANRGLNTAIPYNLLDSQVNSVHGKLTSAVTAVQSNTLSVSAASLRILSQLTVWKELNMLRKPMYNSFLNAHYEKVRVGDSLVETPQYIGGTSQLISINEILQQSASTESSPLGTQGATAFSLQSGKVGSYFCNDYGYIIGVAYIIPDMYYEPAMPRNFSRRTKEDFYFPEFANLSMQAILNKEIFMSDDDDWNNTPWGYTGAFDEMRSIPNRIAGDLLNDNYTDLKSWVLRREFSNDNLPSMSTEFLSLHDNVDYTAWKVPSMPKFMLQCANYIKAVRPMPYVAIPKAL